MLIGLLSLSFYISCWCTTLGYMPSVCQTCIFDFSGNNLSEMSFWYRQKLQPTLLYLIMVYNFWSCGQTSNMLILIPTATSPGRPYIWTTHLQTFSDLCLLVSGNHKYHTGNDDMNNHLYYPLKSLASQVIVCPSYKTYPDWADCWATTLDLHCYKSCQITSSRYKSI